MTPSPRRLTPPARIALSYAAIGALWIVLTDYAVSFALDGPSNVTTAQTAKGLTFVLFSTGVVYLLALSGLRASLRDQRALSRALREKERANAEVAELSKAAAHDLKTPLRQVASYLELLDARCGKQLGEDARAYITYAVDGVAQMNDHLNALLTYIQASNRLQGPGRLQALVYGTVETLRPRIHAEAGTVDLDLRAPDIEVPRQLGLVLHHLIDNACAFREPARPLQIAIRVESDGHFLHLFVTDNGIGIAPQHNSEVFALFAHLGGPRREGSTGIGLALCRKIAESLGGTISLQPHEGPGTCFAVRIPVSPTSPHGANPPVPAHAPPA